MTDHESATLTEEYIRTATWEGAPAPGDRPITLNQMSDEYDLDPNTPYTWSHRNVLPVHDGVAGRSRWWWKSKFDDWFERRMTGNKRAARRVRAHAA